MKVKLEDVAETVLLCLGGPDNVTGFEVKGDRIICQLKEKNGIREESLRRLSGIRGIIDTNRLYCLVTEPDLSQNLAQRLNGLLKSDKPGFWKSLFGKMKRS